MIGKVFRAINDTVGAKRDRHGDPVDDDGIPVGITDEDGAAYIGTIDDIWISDVTPGAPTVATQSTLGAPSRQETSDSNVSFCCPKDGIVLKYGDRVVVGNMKFEIKTNANWNDVNPLTGTDFGRFYVQAVGRIG
ncbi:MAG: hypothetical protein A4E20_10830 [Nitrospira sp. SG-bin2]|uniref:hypothetical protein n=1 Tax=Nitrospira cf. moscoviensis SBR1015 TaxID=96242 RepID=UPI000A0B94FD|nr:hypothetical protein [Nitrospira cf. moscoviensis SBR1015]OQW34506.1 MAG: hypothetical protein A4E20_10830 [Nitrospira sp. SG-bin2]